MRLHVLLNILKAADQSTIIIFFVLQLVLRDNDLVELPKALGNLTRLKELHIQNNRLMVLPPELGVFNSVRYFPLP